MLDALDSISDSLAAEAAFTLAVAVLVVGLFASYLAWRLTHSLFRRTGLADTVEGTTVERAAGRFGTSTAGIIGMLFALLVYAFALIVAFNITQVFDVSAFWVRLGALLPQLFVAILAIIIGFALGDRAKLAIQERLRSVKLPRAAVIPELVKYSIYYIAALIALAQVGVATTALLLLLAAYAFGIVLLAAVAFKDLLAAGAAGLFLILNEPFTIGDEVRVDGQRGIVQEMTLFVTHIEADGEEHVVPNHQVFRSGIVRVRD
jgi:small-conductance mechanosensitive channel